MRPGTRLVSYGPKGLPGPGLEKVDELREPSSWGGSDGRKVRFTVQRVKEGSGNQQGHEGDDLACFSNAASSSSSISSSPSSSEIVLERPVPVARLSSSQKCSTG